MPPAIARTPTTEQATMTCRLTLSRLAWRSRSWRSRSRAAVFEAWLFRLLMVVFSIKGTRTRRVRGDTSIGTGGAQPLFLFRRQRPSTAVHAVPGSARGSRRARRPYGGRGALGGPAPGATARSARRPRGGAAGRSWRPRPAAAGPGPARRGAARRPREDRHRGERPAAARRSVGRRARAGRRA